MDTKRIYFVISGTGDDSASTGREVEINEDTTPADILGAQNLSLDDWRLEVEQDQEQGIYQVLANHEPLFDYVDKNAKVFAKPAGIVVGS